MSSHHQHYLNNNENTIKTLSPVEETTIKFKLNLKPIKILFSGSTNNKVYGKFTWFTEDKVKLLNRIEIIVFIIINFNDKIFFLNSYEELNKVYHSKTPIILSVNDGLIKKSKTNLSNSQHLELISKSNFILTAPGADMPLCHHLIEGIKMKTIPISNYAYLHKPLMSNNDYIYFNDYESLHKSILTALNMSDEEIKIKQDNLEKFYNEKLSPTSFLNTFEKSPLCPLPLMWWRLPWWRGSLPVLWPTCLERMSLAKSMNRWS